jgi:hypothetical protein
MNTKTPEKGASERHQPRPEAAERQLANLTPAPPAPEGNTRNLRHGARRALTGTSHRVRLNLSRR